MAAEVIDGKAIARRCAREVAREVDAWVAEGGSAPGLATVLVGDDPASAVYVGGKQKACAEVGIEGFDHRLPADAPQDEVGALLRELNADPRVSGILLQLPTPPQIDGAALTALIDPAQGRRRADADLGRPAGPGQPGPAAVHAGGRDGAAAPARRRARGRRGGRGRALDLVGKPVAAAAAGRERHGDRSATRARATSPRCAAAPTCWSPPSAARDGAGRLGQAGRGGDRRRHQPHRRRPGRRRRLRGRGRARAA